MQNSELKPNSILGFSHLTCPNSYGDCYTWVEMGKRQKAKGKRQKANPPVSPLERGEGKSKSEVHFVLYSLDFVFSFKSFTIKENWSNFGKPPVPKKSGIALLRNDVPLFTIVKKVLLKEIA